MSSIATIAARNILRNKFRTTLTIVGASVAVLLFVALRTVLTAWSAGVDHAAQDRIATRHKVSFIMQLPMKYVHTVRDTPGVTAVTWMNWFGARDPKDLNNFFATIAVDPKSFLDVYDEIVIDPATKERWIADRQGAILGDVLARKLGVKVGDRLTLSGTIYPGDWQFNVSGIYTAARRSADRSGFFFHYEYMNQSLPEARRDQVGWVASRISDPGRGADISAKIDAAFDEKDIQTVTMSERAMNLSFMGMLSAIFTALNYVSVIILVIMMMILGNTIAMGVRERTNEYGVLRALGFAPRHVATFILGEALTIGFLAGVVGIGISYPLIELGIGRWLEENMGNFFPYFRIDRMTMVVALGLSVALGVLSALLPAYRASQLSVTDALRRVA